MKITGGSTKSLADHLRNIHNVDVNDEDEILSEKVKKIDQYVTNLPVIFFFSIRFNQQKELCPSKQ